MKCQLCPVPAGLECVGESHDPVCGDVARGMPGRGDQLVAIATGSTTAIDAEHARVAMEAELCEHASGPCGCGSGPPRECSHPDRPDKVRRIYCLRCKAGLV